MAERSGFYPSNPELGINNEYLGYEMGNLYRRVLSNGVFANNDGTPSNDLQVLASAGLTVTLKAGMGIFLGQWYINDSDINFTLEEEASSNRIDLIVIEANKSETVLTTKAKLIKGTAATVPTAPELIFNDTVAQYPVAQINITAGISTITQSSIKDLRGTSPTLWITSLVQQVDTTTLFNQFDDAFWTWFNNVKETLATTTLIRKYTGYVNSIEENQTEFTVPISEYNSVLDILQVHIEGRILREGVDYEKNGTTGITLTNGLPVVGTLLYFEVFKSVDGSDAETYVQRLYALEQRVGKSIITSDTGTDKLTIVSSFGTEILNKGIGFHTLYVPNTITGLPVSGKVWRGWSSFTSATKGYVVVISEDGDVYTINYNSGWGVWRGLYQHNKALLYTSTDGNVLAATSTVAPTKPLSRCANGWILHFNNFHYHVPKVRYDGSNWNGEYVLVEIPYNMSADGTTRQTGMKKIVLTDTTISGVEANVLSVNKDIKLFGITEY